MLSIPSDGSAGSAIRWRGLALCVAGLCLVLVGCGGGAAASQPAVPATPPPGAATVAAITIDAGVVLRQVPRSLFGVNVEWTGDGNGVWDPVAKTPVPDLAQRASDLGVGPIRFPGGAFADAYHWQDGVGDRALRPQRSNGLGPTLYANDFGTAELAAFAAATGGTPLIQANVFTGTASEAHDWVAYCNDPANAQRIADGHAAPFNVRWWEVGNEQYYAGGSGDLTAAAYTSRFQAFATAMRSADASITIAAVGGLDSYRVPTTTDPNWNVTLLSAAGSQIDLLALHDAYAPVMFTDEGATLEDVYHAMLAYPQHLAQNLRDVDTQIQTYAPGSATRMRLAITEWGPLFHVLPTSRWVDHCKTLGSALYAADAMQVFVTSKRVDLATYFKYSDPVFIGLVDYLHQEKAAYGALQMWSRHFGTALVRSSASSPTFDAPAVGSMPASTAVPYLDVAASLSADSSTLYVMVINKHFTDSMATSLSIAGFVPNTAATVWTLTGPAMDANNGNDLMPIPGLTWAVQAHQTVGSCFDTGAPGTVAIRSSAWLGAGASSVFTFPARSVTCLELTRAPAAAPKPPLGSGARSQATGDGALALSRLAR